MIASNHTPKDNTMKNIKVILGCLTLLTTISAGCTVTTSGSLSSTSPTPAVKASPAATTAAAKTVPTAKVVPVPANWITMEDSQKGYSFEVPEGTERHSEKSNGVDVFMAATPKPTDVQVMVMAFKDPNLTKDHLIKVASGALEGLGAKNVKVGSLTELSDDYSLATFTATGEDGKPLKGKALVATDVTDNYVMLVGAEEPQYQANEKVIDQIWGSFSMHSGGASGKS
jgi:hypothetical protein